MGTQNKVHITVEEFKDISAARDNWTTAKVTLQDGHNNKIEQDPVSGEIKIKGGMNILFTFNIKPADGGSPDFAHVPVGIGFKSLSGYGDEVGEGNFPKCVIDTETVSILGNSVDYRTMTLTVKHKDKTSEWEFFIVLQQVSTGALGIIDPKIRNV